MPHDIATLPTVSSLDPNFRIKFTNRDFESIVDELINLIQQTRPDLQSDFFETNLGIMLLQFNALIGDLVSGGQDNAALELYLATLRRYESALRFARSVGFRPRSATPAEVTVQDIALPEAVTTSGATVPAGSVLTSGGLAYELLADAVIPIGSTISRLDLFEGTSFIEEFDPTNRQSQEVIVANGVGAEDSFSVFVGDAGIPTNEWTEVAAIALELSATETYETFFDGDGKLHVIFGDGIAGKIPDDTITVNYRTTAGEEGNAPVNSVTGAVTANIAGGGTVSISYRNIDDAASGGTDRESVEELRVSIPAFIRSTDKALTLLDYDTLVLRVPGVSLAFADISLASFEGNIVRVHVWDSAEVTFTGESPLAQLQSSLTYDQFVRAALTRVNEIQAFLTPRSLVTVHNTIIRPDLAFLDFYLGEIRVDERFDTDTVHNDITQAVVAVFEASGGFAIRISDVYRAVDDVTGVRSFTIDRVVLDNLSKITAKGVIFFIGAAQPADGDAILINDGVQGTVTFEFDDDSSVGPSSILVQIGATSADTMRNLIARMNEQLNIIAIEDLTAPVPTVDLEQRTPGADFNLPMGLSGAGVAARIDATGMAGGSDDAIHTITDYRRVQTPVPDLFPPGRYAPGSPHFPGVRATGLITFTGATQPTSGDTVILDDKVQTALTFGFGTGGDVTVAIGATAADTAANLIAAINASPLDLFATDTTSGDPEITVEHNRPGTAGNTATIGTTGITPPTVTLLFTGGSDTGSSSWLTGGQLPYREIQDIVIEAVRTNRRFYDETFLYNNEINYDAGVATASEIQALVLRRLVFEFVGD